MSQIENITVKGELLFTLDNFEQWVNKINFMLPDDLRRTEKLLWIDSNNNCYEIGEDFIKSKELGTFPCRVYRLQSVSSAQHR